MGLAGENMWKWKIFTLGILFMAAAQYIVFKQGAEVRPRPGTGRFTRVWGSRTGNPKLPTKPSGGNTSASLTTGS